MGRTRGGPNCASAALGAAMAAPSNTLADRVRRVLPTSCVSFDLELWLSDDRTACSPRQAPKAAKLRPLIDG